MANERWKRRQREEPTAKLRAAHDRVEDCVLSFCIVRSYLRGSCSSHRSFHFLSPAAHIILLSSTQGGYALHGDVMREFRVQSFCSHEAVRESASRETYLSRCDVQERLLEGMRAILVGLLCFD